MLVFYSNGWSLIAHRVPDLATPSQTCGTPGAGEPACLSSRVSVCVCVLIHKYTLAHYTINGFPCIF